MANTADDRVAADAEWLAREIECCRTSYYEAGETVALLDALALCAENSAVTPSWVPAEALRLLADGMLNNRPPGATGKGRTGNPIAKYKATMVDIERWGTVKYIREKQRFVSFRYLFGADGKIRRDERVGTTWPDAFHAAAIILRGGFAQGSEAAIKASYSRVQGGIVRFHVPRSAALRHLLDRMSR